MSRWRGGRPRPEPAQEALSACDCTAGAEGLSRRTLLRSLAIGGALGGTLTVVDGFIGRYAFAAAPGGYCGDVLVVLSLRGGFDGLSAVAPVGDPDYAGARPSIAVPPRAALPADGLFGLHPALAPLQKYWDSGMFAAVHAVGQHSPSRSHFQAAQELERAAAGSDLRTGWLDRTLGTRSVGNVFQATQVGSGPIPMSLAGPSGELSVGGIDSFRIAGAPNGTERRRWSRALRTLHADAPDGIAEPAGATLRAASVTAQMARVGYRPANGAVYPKDSALGAALRDVARMVKAGVGLQVACLDEGDWDLHAGAGGVGYGPMHRKLDELAHCLDAFATDLGRGMNRVTLVTLSEFGRRVAENGSGGTDHGHGNAVLLLGGGVNGGRVHGRWPGLAADSLVDGDLAGTTDYRLVLGEILRNRCGVRSLSRIFPGLTGEPLGVVRAR